MTDGGPSAIRREAIIKRTWMDGNWGEDDPWPSSPRSNRSSPSQWLSAENSMCSSDMDAGTLTYCARTDYGTRAPPCRPSTTTCMDVPRAGELEPGSLRRDRGGVACRFHPVIQPHRSLVLVPIGTKFRIVALSGYVRLVLEVAVRPTGFKPQRSANSYDHDTHGCK